jgi:hypothetical protein
MKTMTKYQKKGEVISGPLNQNEQAMYDRTVTYKDKMPNVDLQKLRNTLVTKGLNTDSKSLTSKKSTKGKMKKTKMKTGGMVNSNAKVSASKIAKGSVGGISKALSKDVVKSTSPKGKVGGVSKAPKKASPVKLAKAKMGGMKGKSC